MTLSLAAEAPSFFVDEGPPSFWRRRCSFGPVCGWLLGIATCVLVTISSIVLRSVDILRSDYLERLDALDKRLEELEPLYRWPLPYDEVLHYQCLYASGGGMVSARGGLPKTRQNNDPKLCSTVFTWYFDDPAGQYWADLDLISKNSIAFLTSSKFEKGNSSNLVIFDIDETLLSNITPYVPDASEDDDTSSNDQKHTEDEFAPALQAIKDVYMAVYSHGMSVAMITGRSETSRKFTEDNLKDQGFGEACTQDGKGNVYRTKQPCYVALHLRNMKGDQHTLASVFKPERRKQLQDAGYTLVGSFGDQFSDLEGEHSAMASWKIPNPMYLIL